MTSKTTQSLVEQVRDLSPAEFAEFRRWFLSYDRALAHDHEDPRQIRLRRLDARVVEALAEYQERPARDG
ncbi:MAG: hypothetical protein O9284_04770 [Steroidobacteraceae bacterium]|jgi:hypothetical protein|nr:hypothetical protein [Steroidobacteraceae bacterium]